jgi:hypothetical protein
LSQPLFIAILDLKKVVEEAEQTTKDAEFEDHEEQRDCNDQHVILEASPLETYMCYALLDLVRSAHLRFEFSFSLNPIIQVMARLPATFNIDFICSNSDCFEARRIGC